MTRSLRILSVLGQRPTSTGSGVLVQELLQSSVRSGDQNWLVCGAYLEDEWYDIIGNAYSVVTFSNKTSQGQLPFPIPGMSDVMPYYSVPYGKLTSAQVQNVIKAYGEKIREIVADFNPNLIHNHHLWILTDILQVLTNVPCIVTVHGTDLKLAKTALQHRHLVVRNLARIQHLLCVSQDMAYDARVEYGIEEERETVIGNGYNPDIFSVSGPRHEFSEKVVLCVGKFVPWKGFRYVIRACAKVSTKHQLVILGAGTDAEHKKLIDEASKEGLKVIFPGQVTQLDVAKWMRCADVFVLPSIHEPFGLVLLEALACGCKVVASGSGGPKDIISLTLLQHGLASLISPLNLSAHSDEPRYVEDFSNAIELHLRSVTTLHQRNFIAESVRELTWDAVYKRIREIYLEITKDIAE